MVFIKEHESSYGLPKAWQRLALIRSRKLWQFILVSLSQLTASVNSQRTKAE